MATITLEQMKFIHGNQNWKPIANCPLGVYVFVRGTDFMGHWWYGKVKAELKGDATLQQKLAKKPFHRRVKWIEENGHRWEGGDLPDDFVLAESCPL